MYQYELLKAYDKLCLLAKNDADNGRAPIAQECHKYQEISHKLYIDDNGNIEVEKVCLPKNEPPLRIQIPITDDSAGRSGTASKESPHGLSDSIDYIVHQQEGIHFYKRQLLAWIKYNESSEQGIRANKYLNIVYKALENGNFEKIAESKVMKEKEMPGFIVDGVELWVEQDIKDSWVNFVYNEYAYFKNSLYDEMIDKGMKDKKKVTYRSFNYCPYLNEDNQLVLSNALKLLGNGKMISSNIENQWKGRFQKDKDIFSMSLKAHFRMMNALSYYLSNQCFYGTKEYRYMLFNPNIPQMQIYDFVEDKVVLKDMPDIPDTDYKKLRELIFRAKNSKIENQDSLVLLGTGTISDGRMAVTTYEKFNLSKIIQNIKRYEEHFVRPNGKGGNYIIGFSELINLAFDFKKTEADSILKNSVYKNALPSFLTKGIISHEIEHKLINRAARFTESVDKKSIELEQMSNNAISNAKKLNEKIIAVAAMVMTYNRKDKENMSNLNRDNKDRSYNYGRLLAILETEENHYYFKKHKNVDRLTNAERLRESFVRTPQRTLKVLLERITPYEAALHIADRTKYKDLIDECIQNLNENDMNNQSLNENWILGYSHQRAEICRFYKKNTEDAILDKN